jgi:hypothetical protein
MVFVSVIGALCTDSTYFFDFTVVRVQAKQIFSKGKLAIS